MFSTVRRVLQLPMLLVIAAWPAAAQAQEAPTATPPLSARVAGLQPAGTQAPPTTVPTPAPSPDDGSKARIDQLEKELREMKQLMMLQLMQGNPQPPRPTAPSLSPKMDQAPIASPQSVPPVNTVPIGAGPAPIGNSLPAAWQGDKKDETPASPTSGEGTPLELFRIGKDNKLNVTWDAGGFRFKSDDGNFNIHMGGRMMTDEVWWTQSPGTRASNTQPAGSPLAVSTGVGPGVGDLQDGFFLRRARFVADGTIYKYIEFKTEFDFEPYNSISFDESYVGAKDLPFVDTVRIGQMHVPFGLEAFTSSRFLPMMERSPSFDAFYQEFAPGIFTNTTFLDKHMTMQHMFHRIDNFAQFNGASFGDGKYAYSGRVSILPYYLDEGRDLLHLGIAYQIRNGSSPADFNGGTTLTSTPNSAVTENTDLIRFRARPSIRDSIGLQGDSARVVDTGNIIADDVQSVNGELLWYWRSFWIQSETCYSHVDNAVFPASNTATQRGSLNYYGTYFQTGFFLTGEQRGYDRRFGKYDRVKPLQNFFLTRDECGRCQYGIGAWEMVYRYSYLNLNDDNIQGGIYSEHTIGLNWYWNPNIKLQLNYVNGHRDVIAGAASGYVQGIGLRAALEF